MDRIKPDLGFGDSADQTNKRTLSTVKYLVPVACGVVNKVCLPRSVERGGGS